MGTAEHAKRFLRIAPTARREKAKVSLAVVLLGSALCLTTGAHAQSTAPAADDSLTFHGITLSGVIDIGVQHDTHGAPISSYYPAGTDSYIVKQDNHPLTAVIPSGLSQSKVTLSGKEQVSDEFSGVFKLETLFNPQAGTISDGLKALTINNGVALASQTMASDSSIAGQAFNGAAYAGISSKHFGTMTFGRQMTLLADGVSIYDPMATSQAFSVIGTAGTYAGGGDTEDRRLDGSIKYTAVIDHIHLGALYKMNQSSGEARSAYGFQLGASAGNASIDVYYEKVRDAISAASLSAAQVTALATACPACAVDTSLAGTVSDNETYSVMGSYKIKRIKLFGAYERIEYKNPSDPLTASPGGSYNTIGGYTIAYANLDQNAYAIPKKLDLFWLGAQLSVTRKISLWAAYYHFHQNSYATGTHAGCMTAVNSGCSGDLQAMSAVAIYSVAKRLDVYTGVMASNVTNGFASGYLHTADADPTVGLRVKF